MLPAVMMLAAANHPTPRCEAATISAVVRDADDAAPFVLEIPDGRRFRTLGTDFIHVSRWKRAEPLRLCLQQAESFPVLEITDTKRGESVLAEPIKQRVFAATCIEQESGDTGGWIVALSGPGPHPRVLFSWSEGALMEPAAATAHYLAASGRLNFTVRTETGIFRFTGKLRPHEMVGTLHEPWRPGSHSVSLVEMSEQRAEHPTSACRPLGQ